MKMRFTLLLINLAIFSSTVNFSQVKNSQDSKSFNLPAVLSIPKIEGEIILDGLSNEPAWDNVTSYEMITLQPVRRMTTSERTEVLFAYDEEYLYLAGRMYDSQPSEIQISSYERDSGSPSMDWIAFMIDSFNDNETGLAFATTPSALRWDAAIAGDYQSSGDRNDDWNTYWDVEVTTNDEGWFAEMRIPFSSLNFSADGNSVEMGITSWRIHPRTNETQVFPAIKEDWGFRGVMKPSVAQDIHFDNLKSSRAVYFTPYVLGGYGQYRELNDNETAYDKNREYPLEFGADLKYGLTSKLTLDVTLNTDFAQVEADDYQINLTRYSLFFPEKRRFFQERAGTFDFTFESTDNNRLFHSRRIGIYNGEPVRIYGGARLSGKIDEWDVGLLNMQTASVDTLPSENFGVFRMKRNFINSGSYIGGILTSRIGDNGNYNLGYGFDTRIQYLENDFFALRFAQTIENNKDFNPFNAASSRLMFKFWRNNNIGYRYGLSVNYSGKDYNPGVGFQKRSDYTRLHIASGYGWVPEKKDLVSYHSVFVHALTHISNHKKKMESANAGISWYFENQDGYYLELTSDFYREIVDDNFDLTDDVSVPMDNYNFIDFGASFYTPDKNLYSAGVSLNTGSFYDGWKNSLSLDASTKLSASLNLDFNYSYNHVNFSDRKSSFNSHLGRIKVLYMMNKKFSINAFVQFNTLHNLVSANVKLRYNPAEGIDLYLVYNENLNTDRYRTSPVLPTSMGRTILVKYNYTLGF